MARVWTFGSELNSTSLENAIAGGGSSISSSTLRSGTYAWRSNPSAALDQASYQYRSGDTQENLFARAYINIATLPSADTNIFGFFSGGAANKIMIRLTTGGLLQIRNHEDSVQIGSNSAALSTGVWYRIELNQDTTTLASTVVEAKLDGVTFASGTANLANATRNLQWGIHNTAATADIFFDDIALNDSSGSFQNSWPGAGSINHLKPSAAGDNTQFTTGVADNTNHYVDVQEVTPDDDTSYIQTVTTNHIDDFNIADTPAGIGSSDTINVVAIGVRYRKVTAGTATFVLRVKASSGGTVEESANITTSGTGFSTNASATPRNYSLTLYDLPGASTTAWTKTDLDAAQIGARFVSDSDGNNFRISTLWMLVDYTPAAAPAGTTQATGFMTTNTGFWGA